MAEKYVQNTKYKYDLNASLVISGNAKKGGGGGEGGNDPSGEGASLAGRNLNTFGDRVVKEKPQEIKEKALKKLEK